MKLKFTFLNRSSEATNWLSFTHAANGGVYCIGCTHNRRTGDIVKTCLVDFCMHARHARKQYPICLNPIRGTSFWKRLIKFK